MKKISFIKLSLLVSVMVLSCGLAAAQTTVFSFQGKLPNSMTPANGSFEMEFKLFDAAAGGNQIGATVSLSNVEVKTGSFSVQLDFGAAAFPGADRFIEISVRRQGDAAPFQVIAPRAQVLSVPYAIRALSAATADTLSGDCEECITDAQIESVDGSKITGTVASAAFATNAQNVTNATNAANADTLDNIDSSAFVQTNTTAFIRNQTGQQAADFNISGTGKANIFDVATQYNIDGFRILSAPTGTANLYAGFAAGNNPGTGTRNSAFGYYAGESTNSGGDNSFFGHFSGRFTVGSRNSFFGTSTGYNTRGGNDNTFVGGNAGLGNTVGSNNTLLGSGANVLNPDLTFATAIGAGAVVSTNNTIVFGRTGGADTVQIPGNLNVGGTISGTFGGTANNALNLGGVAANQFVQTNDMRLSDARNPLPNSPNYIQNTTTEQTSSAFNISGNGTAGGTLSGNVVNAATHFNIGGSRILSNPGYNLFAGIDAGSRNTTGYYNAFFGLSAGFSNTIGSENSFFGTGAGYSNTTGDNNSFFGGGAGRDNTTGVRNSFFGSQAGIWTTTGGNNSFFGMFTGFNNTTGDGNSFVGVKAGFNNTMGDGNSFVGVNAGLWNTTGVHNTIIGTNANVGAGDLQNATAVGANSFVTQSNSLVLGGISGVNSGTDTKVGIGLTNPTYKLQVNDASNAGLRVQTNAAGGTVASFGGSGAFQIDASGINGGRFHVSENGNVGIGTNAPTEKLEVNGVLRVNSLGSIGGTQLCRNLSNQISNCSSSLRYKNNIASFLPGLSFVKQLRPITFDWKEGGSRDIGFGAEDVAKINPLFVIYNEKGEIEGVKYDRLSVAFVNAFKEQQTQIQRQQQQIDRLKALVCELKPEAAICKEEQK